MIVGVMVDRPDHPRSRGEHDVEAVAHTLRNGSSPLARGAHFDVSRVTLVGRIIPARAGSTRHPTRTPSTGRDHPRSRGEHVTSPVVSSMRTASSPLARGARAELGLRPSLGRIIPARAGSTAAVSATRSPAGDHPRSRGEHDLVGNRVPDLSGSSPLARGALTKGFIMTARRRIIPARAGSTVPRSPSRPAGTDHPRSRGEHSGEREGVQVSVGSSPLARGAQRVRGAGHPGSRIIPARAGSTHIIRGVEWERVDHPRSRGEHWHVLSHPFLVQGSSPLARGARVARRVVVVHGRIIPARAGSTVPATTEAGRRGDHPRSRGEHHWRTSEPMNAQGSSPLARGAPGQAGLDALDGRIIPARAGSTRPRPRPWQGSGDHPRSRGEHGLYVNGRTAPAGSSPLARGALLLGGDGGEQGRIIPARAGSTSSRPSPRAR